MSAPVELDRWPALPLDSWRETCATLHMWTQIVGKVRLRLAPLVNHWWNVPLYVSARGLTTSRIPYEGEALELTFDFIRHQLVLETSRGQMDAVALEAQPVADFYSSCMEMFRSAGIQVRIWKMPVEVPDPVAFDQDRVHAAYDADAVEKFWRILLSVDDVLQRFRGGFIGKCSPVHFFWGSFDLAVTRFSGRPAPPRPGADTVTREAYSHEVSSVGFWPGSGSMKGPAFYSYSAPEPAGFRDAKVRPEGTRYDAEIREFLLDYEDLRTRVRSSEEMADAVLDFCQSTYEAGAQCGGWDRQALER